MNGSNGMKGGADEHGMEDVEISGPTTSTPAWDRLSAFLPLLLTTMADRSQTQSERRAFRLQMLFWIMSIVVDQLEATKGVIERARDRLRDIDPGPRRGIDAGDGADW